ncbi:hypothetical protein LCGC14_0434400 [marine sediment metagenome]|uniref:Uncharacterized protein n=1 Tax=marine sediment metagenome TaxID=412755 RepID=A0A0F9SM83_9ZZZZ
MNNLTTLAHGLLIARNEADEDVSLLDLTTEGDYASIPSVLGNTGVGVIDLLKDKYDGATEMIVNGIEFMFSGGSAADKTFGWRVLAWKTANGPARLIAVGTGILGTQAVVTYPLIPGGGTALATNKFWADTLVVTARNWPKGIESTDSVGNNSVSSIWVDDAGYRFWKIEITDADGSTGTEAGDISVYFGYW